MDSVTVTKRKPGRPTKSKDGLAMPSRLRQRLYRARKRAEATTAIGDEKNASTSVLVGLLAVFVKGKGEGSVAGVKRILAELCNRYEIDRGR